MASSRAWPVLNPDLRVAVARAAGQDYLDELTHRCLADCMGALALTAQQPQGTQAAEAARHLHRAAGGAAVVGLSRLCQALQRLERACARPSTLNLGDWSHWHASATAALSDTRSALLPPAVSPPSP